jgi:hypothetical protein
MVLGLIGFVSVTVIVDREGLKVAHPRINHAAMLIASSVVLIAAWYIVLFILVLFFELTLAPWQYAAHLAPPPGTLARELNDFFSLRDNVAIPFLIFLGFDLIICAYRIIRAPDWSVRSWLPLAFATTSGVLIVFYFGVSFIYRLGIVPLWMGFLSFSPHFRVLDGYERSIPECAIFLLFAAALFWSRWRIDVLRNWARGNK